METIEDWECHPDCPIYQFNQQAGSSSTKRNPSDCGGRTWGPFQTNRGPRGHTDSGGRSRFYFNADWSMEVLEKILGGPEVFYTPKVPSWEKNAGLGSFYWKPDASSGVGFARIDHDKWEALKRKEKRILEETGDRVSLCMQGCIHPTAKPITLTTWLATLLLPPPMYAPRRIAVPFGGFGSEAIGAMLAGWEEIVLVETMPEYVEMADSRLRWWSQFNSIDEARVVYQQLVRREKKREVERTAGFVELF